MRVVHAALYAWRMTSPWRPMIRDATGKPVPLYRLDRALPRALGTAELPAGVFDRLRGRLLTQSRAGMDTGPIGLLFLGALCLGWLVWMLGLPGAPALGPYRWAILALAGIFVFSAWTYRYRIPRIRREAVAQALLGESRCPSCAYDLRAAPRGDAGLSRCPECGACWRLPGECGEAPDPQ